MRLWPRICVRRKSNERENMREKFELASKIIGLVFWGFGFITFVCVILIFVLKPDAMQMLPESARAVYNQSQIKELQNMTNYATYRYILVLAIVSVFEVFFGVYLMNSNNLFIKLCYPFENQNIPSPTPDIQLEIKTKESQMESKKPSEDKYAPPGYFQK